MSNHHSNADNADSGSSGKPSYSHQSRWMSPSTQLPRKLGSLIAPHSQTYCKEEGLHHKQKHLRASLNTTSDIPGCIRAQNFSSYDSQSARKRIRSSMLVLATNKTTKSSEGDAKDHPSNSMHLYNNEFTRKYEKFSTVLVHERNSFSAILSRNQNDFPLFSQIETRSFLITKRMGVDNLSKGDQIVQESTKNGGVKIQPLWSSTDSEKDNLGDHAPTPKSDRSCDLSSETNKMDAVAYLNKNDVSGVRSSPSVKHTVRDNTLHTTSVDPHEDKARGKFPVTEMPDAGSMDGTEPSTLRTQSLEVEHLQEPSGRCNKECTLREPSSSLWVKRLKPSSSEVGESSSHDKTHMLNKSSPDKELLSSDQSKMGPVMSNDQSLSRKNKDSIFQCSWIQRWCQDDTVTKYGKIRSKGSVICELDSSKFVFDEAKKKQFPSIAAMALMGKSMNGFHPCKLTKRGPLVVWNTDDN